MQRSGSQKVLLVLSIITIVFAGLGLIFALLTVVGGAFISGADPNEVADVVGSTGVSQEAVATGLTFAGVVLLLAFGVELLEGILGVRAANDNQKIMPLWVLALIGVIIALIGCVLQVMNGRLLDDPQMICSLIGSGIMFWLANNIKVQAGK